MSVFNFEGGAAEAIQQRITSASAITIIDATDSARNVSWFEVTENSGGTPSLTVDIYDGTTPHYLAAAGVAWRVKAMTANQSVRFDQGYVIPVGSLLRVTSNSASGLIDVIGIALSTTPTAPK